MKHQIKYLQNLFYELLNDYGRAFIAVKYSDRTIIGNRGFTDEEKEKGLTMIFNSRNHKNLQWTEDGSIVAALGFGVNNRIENSFLHHEDIVAVFSPDAEVKFDRWDMLEVKKTTEEYSVGIHIMGDHTQRFTSLYPQARVRLEYLHPENVVEAVLSDEADLGIMSYPPANRSLTILPWR